MHSKRDNLLNERKNDLLSNITVLGFEAHRLRTNLLMECYSFLSADFERPIQLSLKEINAFEQKLEMAQDKLQKMSSEDDYKPLLKDLSEELLRIKTIGNELIQEMRTKASKTPPRDVKNITLKKLEVLKGNFSLADSQAFQKDLKLIISQPWLPRFIITDLNEDTINLKRDISQWISLQNQKTKTIGENLPKWYQPFEKMKTITPENEIKKEIKSIQSHIEILTDEVTLKLIEYNLLPGIAEELKEMISSRNTILPAADLDLRADSLNSNISATPHSGHSELSRTSNYSTPETPVGSHSSTSVPPLPETKKKFLSTSKIMLSVTEPPSENTSTVNPDHKNKIEEKTLKKTIKIHYSSTPNQRESQAHSSQGITVAVHKQPSSENPATTQTVNLHKSSKVVTLHLQSTPEPSSDSSHIPTRRYR